jgi:putative membrane protein
MTIALANSLLLTLAHGGKPHSWHDLIRAWGTDPLVLAGMALSGWFYGFGLWKLWRASSVGAGVKRWEAWCYAGGWLALFVALVSPLHPWGRVLFSAHMSQHEILMLIAAPLLVLGRPLIVYLKAIPPAWAHAVGRATNTRGWRFAWRSVSNPLAAWVIHAVALWVWHVPALFDATTDNELVHTLQHASFLGSALLFWWALIQGRQSAAGYGAAVLFLFTTALHSGMLGVLITFANSLWYTSYQHTTESWGLSPLDDQRLGGLIMWIPAGVAYIVAGLALLAGWMRESDERLIKRQGRAAVGPAGAA